MIAEDGGIASGNLSSVIANYWIGLFKKAQDTSPSLWFRLWWWCSVSPLLDSKIFKLYDIKNELYNWSWLYEHHWSCMINMINDHSWSLIIGEPMNIDHTWSLIIAVHTRWSLIMAWKTVDHAWNLLIMLWKAVDHTWSTLIIAMKDCWSFMINIDRCIISWPLHKHN